MGRVGLDTFKPPKTLQETVTDSLREAIIYRQLKPGERLDQKDLADRFNVSRVPVREALRTLEAEGLVTFHPYRGAQVSVLSAEEIREINQIRIVLEAMALRLALPNITPALCQELEPVVDEMSRVAVEDPVAYAILHSRFHLALYRVSGRTHVCSIIETLRNTVKPYHVAYLMESRRSEKVSREHRKLLELCCSGDEAGVQQVLQQHLVDGCEAITSQICQEEGALDTE